jgi:hypothetical protein
MPVVEFSPVAVVRDTPVEIGAVLLKKSFVELNPAVIEGDAPVERGMVMSPMCLVVFVSVVKGRVAPVERIIGMSTISCGTGLATAPLTKRNDHRREPIAS